MQYRKMGSLGWEVSALGFGCMRLPTKGVYFRLNEKYCIEIIREGIDLGINYVDTAWPYNLGGSEKVLGKALKDGYREKVYVSTKLPLFLVRNEKGFDRYLDEQLKRLQLDCIDAYLFHALNKSGFEKLKRLNLLKKMENARDEGKIKYIGFSFHDTYPVLKEIVDYYDWDIGQIQYNYMDTGIQATVEGLKYLHEKDVAVVIMEPVKGGILANPPHKVLEIFEKADVNRTPVDWALQFLWNQPEVSVVLSGMNSKQMVIENCRSADNSGINSLSTHELETINEVTGAYRSNILVHCTGCEYCQPCPEGVNIPRNFAMLNNKAREPGTIEERFARWQLLRNYGKMAKTPEELKKTGKDGSASLCIECGTCIPKCPQSINIPEELHKVDQIMGKRKKISSYYPEYQKVLVK
ncbi:MAG: aldo/keto reductase [Promethearchaeota archaeon]|jgi:predicted aldo/keto reductase-like oxidoreductase